MGIELTSYILRRERWLILGSMAVVITLAWTYTVHMAGHMPLSEATVSMPIVQPWTWTGGLTAFLMWSVMMVGMMLPTAAPWALTLAGLTRKEEQNGLLTATGGFLIGYLTVWTGFSLAASLLQWMLHDYGLLSPWIGRVSAQTGAVVLVLAGICQWLPIKYACLKHCRSPLSFFLTSWRDGRFGAARMGMQHGLFCVGCCWTLMALSFVVGVMNLLWMAGITIFVFVDHVLPMGKWLSKAAGVALVIWGGWKIAG
jgi:predicted metal-binding membrane protein